MYSWVEMGLSLCYNEDDPSVCSYREQVNRYGELMDDSSWYESESQ